VPLLATISFAACVGGLPGGSLGEPTGEAGGSVGTGGAGGSHAPTADASVAGAIGTGGTGGAGDAAGAFINQFTFVIDAGFPGGLAVDANYLYWTDRTRAALMKMPLSGGDPMPVAPIGLDGGWVAVDGQTIYWSEIPAGVPVVMKTVRAGGPPTLIAAAPDARAFALNHNGVYWTTNAGAVMSVGIDGGPVTTLAPSMRRFFPVLAVDDANAYWSSACGPTVLDVCIMRMALADGATVEMVRQSGSIDSIAVNATHAYWLGNPGPGPGVGPGAMMRVGLAGGAPEVVEANVTLLVMAADASGLYWAGPSGVLVDASPGSARPLGDSGPYPIGALALGATSVFWTAATPPGSIFRASK
jgi:hypothetical protein